MILMLGEDSPGYLPERTVHNGNARPEPAHRLTTDESQQVEQPRNRRRIHGAQVKRHAGELAKSTSEIPPAVEQANRGVLSDDLNDRLKQIAKLLKQFRRQLFQ
jgi:hypothetical protein